MGLHITPKDLILKWHRHPYPFSPEPKIECVSWSIETGADKGRRVYNGTLLSFVHVAVDMDRVRTREDSSVGRKGSGRPIRNCRDVKIRT